MENNLGSFASKEIRDEVENAIRKFEESINKWSIVQERSPNQQRINALKFQTKLSNSTWQKNRVKKQDRGKKFSRETDRERIETLSHGNVEGTHERKIEKLTRATGLADGMVQKALKDVEKRKNTTTF